MLAAAGNFIGPLLIGSAVANTIAGIANVDPGDTVEVSIAALLAAVGWNALTWYRRLPSSSSHALIGGFIGAAIAEAGFGAVNWGGFDGWRPVGVIGVLVALAVSPFLGAARRVSPMLRLLRAALRRATRRFQAAGARSAVGHVWRCSRSATVRTTRRRRPGSSRPCCWPRA